MAPLPPAVVLSPPAAPVGPQELKHKVVDLTEETKPEDDLQRAIALSLQDGGSTTTNAATSSQTVSGVSQEEQDVSKALEASLLETTRGRKKKEEQNPHDRERDGEVRKDLKFISLSCLHIPSPVAGGSEERWSDVLVLCRHPKSVSPSRIPSPGPQLQPSGAAAGLREGAEELGVYGRVAEALCLAAQFSEEVCRSQSGGRHPPWIVGWREHCRLR